MDEEQRKRLTDWLANLKASCPLCEYNDWGTGEIIVAPTYQHGGTIQLSPTPVPMVQVICKRCAYVILLAAGPVGLVA